MIYVESVLELFDAGVIEFRNILEFIALKEQLKPLLRLVVSKEEHAALCDFCGTHSLFLVMPSFRLKPVFKTPLDDTFFENTSVTDPLATHDVVFIARSEERAAQGALLDMNGCSPEEMARLYGYPACCVHNYSRIQQGEHWLIPFLEGSNSILQSWLNNKIAYLFPPHLTIFPDYFPCSIRCEATRSLATNYATLLHRVGLGDLLDLTREQLCRPILIYDEWIYLFSRLEGRYPFLTAEGATLSHSFSTLGDKDALERISTIEFRDDGGVWITHSQGPAMLNHVRGDRIFLFDRV